MKSTVLISLGIASLANGATILKRQGLAQLAQMMPSVTPIVIDAQPQVRKTATRKLLRFGPFMLPANKVRRNSQSEASKAKGANVFLLPNHFNVYITKHIQF
jgi:hypothetical protein